MLSDYVLYALFILLGFTIGLITTFEVIFNKLISRGYQYLKTVGLRSKERVANGVRRAMNKIDIMLYGGWVAILSSLWLSGLHLSWKVGGSGAWLIVLAVYQFWSREEVEVKKG